MQVDAPEKLPPSDLPAERCAIASLMLTGDDREAFAKARRMLWRGAFYQPDNQVILDALDELYASGKPFDATTVRSELARSGMLEQIGGVAYLAELLHGMPSAAHAMHYAKIVSMRAMEREAIRVSNQLSERLMCPIKGDDAREFIQKTIERLQKIVGIGRDIPIWKIGDAIDAFIESRRSGKLTWIETGVNILDREYQGVLRDGGYTLIAARPSMGKSTFIRDLIRRRATTGIKCGLVAVEENQDKIIGNYLSAESNVENSRVAYEYERWAVWEREDIDLAIDRVRPLPICVTDTAFSLADIMAAAEEMVAKFKCRIIAIDHIHLVGGARAENREQQISEISGAFKEFFKRRNVVGIVAAQLNRPEKGICPPPPSLTDLRASGSLEEHADSVLMLHREDYYYRGRDNYDPNGLCQVLIRKNRNGCVGDVVMRADLAHQRFEEEQAEIPSV